MSAGHGLHVVREESLRRCLRTLDVSLVYPADYAQYLREGVTVKLTDRNTSNVYTGLTDAQGRAGFCVAAGHYAFRYSTRPLRR